MGQCFQPDVGQCFQPDVGQCLQPDVGQCFQPDVGQCFQPDVVSSDPAGQRGKASDTTDLRSGRAAHVHAACRAICRGCGTGSGRARHVPTEIARPSRRLAESLWEAACMGAGLGTKL